MKTEIPATRKAAKDLGSKVYLGKPCREYRHHEGRMTSSAECVVCHRGRVATAYRTARELLFTPGASDEPEPSYTRIPDDWMSRPLPKAKRVRRKPGEAFAGESTLWNPA
jgi:hypothetical protein